MLINIDNGGQVNVDQATISTGQIDQRFLTLNINASMTLFKELAIQRPDLVGNWFGLYSFGTISKGSDIRWGYLNMPRHVLQERNNGCIFNAKGEMSLDVTKTAPCKFKYNGKQCPDVFGDCLEAVLAPGNDGKNIMATDAGRRLFAEVIGGIFMAIGNSLYDVLEFGQHPATTAANDGDTYTVPEQEWQDYVDQQKICRGRITHIDTLRQAAIDGDTSLNQYNVQILEADLSANRTEYTGDPTVLFKRVRSAAPAKFRNYARNSRNGNMKPVIEVTAAIFQAYVDHLMSTWDKIDQMFYYFYSGKFCQANGCIETMPIPDVLMWDGYPVIARHDWTEFDEMHGIITHRCLFSAPGVYGIAFDVQSLSQYAGMGLEVVQRLRAPYQGEVYMSTQFDAATAILNRDWVVNASREYAAA